MTEPEPKAYSKQGQNDRRRWLALLLVCGAQLMIVLDGTIVNVALPAIQTSLRFSETGLSWVVNAYLLTFGGFLLLGGRAGDIFGRRRVFAFGLALFTLASLLCGLAGSQGLLVAARALQGVGGAIIAPAALSIIITTFKHPADRARAMGIWAFVVSGGASIGVLLGGVLTQTMGWPWIFFVNLPVGIAALALCRPLLEPDTKPDTRAADEYGTGKRGGFDLPGAFLVTTSLVVAVYTVVGAGQNSPLLSALLLFVAAALMVAFAAVERRTSAPLVPPGVFARSRNLTVSNVVMALAVVGMVGWFFFSALYFQKVLGYDSLATGLAYLPATIALGVISQGPAASAVNRFGIKPTMVGGLGMMALGLLLFARAPVGGNFLVDVLPGMLVLGIGAAFGFMAVILASTAGVPDNEAGLASGLVNTSQQMGGALGLAALAAVAAAYTAVIAGPQPTVAALNAGYHAAFIAGAGCVILGVLLAAVLLRLPKNVGGE
ncbi:MAG TPA: MFS transporter [Rubrobacteraceae bacterium]|nr:MFS transporter [Rubrobacteraceae bacterium]